jgi:hypothetical protein
MQRLLLLVLSITAIPGSAAETVKRRGIEIISLEGELIALRPAQATPMEAYPCRSDPHRTDHDHQVVRGCDELKNMTQW